MHLPHFMQSFWSITECPSTTSIAFFGQLYMQGRAKHPRQFCVETTCASGQPLQAGPQTLSGVFGLAVPPSGDDHAFSA